MENPTIFAGDINLIGNKAVMNLHSSVIHALRTRRLPTKLEHRFSTISASTDAGPPEMTNPTILHGPFQKSAWTFQRAFCNAKNESSELL